MDVVLLATPPGFRPQHLRAAIQANKHVFCEKPIAVDAPGVRHVLETAKMAKEKNLSLVAGFCWRYSNYIQAAFDQLQKGAIGDIVSYYGTYYTSPVKPMPPENTRPAGISDTEWQIRNWYNFVWLSGDGLVEQAIHTADKIAWAFGDKPPVSCVAVGGRQTPNGIGNIYDHFEVNYVYPNNVRAFLGCRQIEGCYNENADYIMGTKGVLTIGRGPLPRIEGQTPWTFEGAKNDMYQAEHDVLFAAVRKGQPINDGERMATSTLLGIMGRMAAYTGQTVTWDQALNSKEQIFPEKLDWKGAAGGSNGSTRHHEVGVAHAGLVLDPGGRVHFQVGHPLSAGAITSALLCACRGYQGRAPHRAAIRAEFPPDTQTKPSGATQAADSCANG